MTDGILTNARSSIASPKSLLAPDEKLLWWGQPKMVRHFAFAAAVILSGAIVLIFNSFVLSDWFGNPERMRLYTCVVATVLLLVLFFGLLSVRATFYAITDRRAIIIRGEKRKDIDLRHVKDVILTQHVFGISNILFIDQYVPSKDDFRQYVHRPDGFFAVDNAAKCESILRQAILNVRTK